ncbi:MAG: MEDS domain-containing protein, partial [Dehalococcoidia bacterium]
MNEAIALHGIAAAPAHNGGQAITQGQERINAGTLVPQLHALRHGDHFCSFYEDRSEQMAIVAPFFKECLERGEACLYVVDDRTVEEVMAALERVGVDAEAARSRGALTFLSKQQWRNPGDFDVEVMAADARELIRSALAPGFTGLWTAVDMTWALAPDISPEDLAVWESHWNRILRDIPVVLLCQCNRSRLSPETLHHELRTHPMAILGGHVYPNFFYEPPDVYLGRTDHRTRVDWMVGQLRLASVAEAERKRRMRTEIMLREIHHRVKNSLQIAASLLSLQAIEMPDAECATALLDSEARLRTIALIHSALYAVEGETQVDLRDVLPRIAESHRADHGGVSVEVVADEVLLDVDTAVPCALVVNELVSNAFKHAFPGDAQGQVLLQLTQGDDGQVAVMVQDDGRGMPPYVDWRAPRSLGLRLVHALSHQIGGTVRMDTDQGATFTVAFPCA